MSGFDGGVLPGGDAQAVQVGLAALDGGLPLGLAGLGGEVADQGLGRLVEGAGRLAGGVPLDPAPRRVGGGPGDPGQLEGAAVDPGAVAVGGLQQHRPVGDHRVQGGPVGAGGAEGVHDPAAAEDPGGRRGGRRRSGPRWPRTPPARPRGGRTGPAPGRRRRCGRARPGTRAGPARRPGRSTRVDGPRRSASSRSGPAAATRPARTATASAQGRAGSAVYTGAPTMSRSASGVMAAPRR